MSTDLEILFSGDVAELEQYLNIYPEKINFAVDHRYRSEDDYLSVGEFPLYNAAKNNKTDIVDFLLSKNANLNGVVREKNLNDSYTVVITKNMTPLQKP